MSALLQHPSSVAFYSDEKINVLLGFVCCHSQTFMHTQNVKEKELPTSKSCSAVPVVFLTSVFVFGGLQLSWVRRPSVSEAFPSVLPPPPPCPRLNDRAAPLS